jgi:glutathione S-transferase
MPFDPNHLTITNPVFHAYLLAASIMLLKLMLQPWMTVQRMMKVRAGFRSPEDAKQTPLNPDPREGQLEPNEYVERSRRMNLNDLESIPGFLVAGLLFVLAGPPVLFGEILIWTYVAARAAHFVAYATAQIHDVRATLWTVSSLSVLVMTGYVLLQAI